MEARQKELMENQLRVVMIDRMLKEKYNEISYLAIQPRRDLDIVEVNRRDLDWLLTEQKRCESLGEQKEALEKQYRDVMNSKAWRLGIRISKFAGFFLAPIRVLYKKEEKPLA